MILIDTNVFMYAAGADHPHKVPAVRFLERVARGGLEAAIDAETLQEILHRYRALRRWADGRRVYDLARKVVPTVIPVDVEILDVARSLLDAEPDLVARDALHAGVVRVRGLSGICSYDRDFDRLAWLRRTEP